MTHHQKKPRPPNPSLVSYIHLLKSETLLTRQPALWPGWLLQMCQMYLLQLESTGFYVHEKNQLLPCHFTGMGLNLKQESGRMKSTIQSLISSTPATHTMPTTVIRLMNLRRAKHRNHLQLYPRLCSSRPCSNPSSSLKK